MPLRLRSSSASHDHGANENDPVPSYEANDITIDSDSPLYRPDIVPAFFKAIEIGDVGLVTSLLDANPALANVSHLTIPGLLPLYSATVTGNTYLVAYLAQRGAAVDQLSATGEYYDENNSKHRRPIMRTALMAAASQGSLPLVKLLFFDLHADDGVVAPDGAIALRLAIKAKHREIVEILPARRAGGWIRFKHSQRKALRRIREAGYALYRCGRFFLWEVPRFVLWTVPKALLWHLPKYLFPIIGKWMWRTLKKIPQLPAAIYNWTKRVARRVWNGIKAFPRLTVKFAQALWKGIKGIPKFIWDVAEALWKGIKGIPKFIWDVAEALATFTKWLAKWTWRFVTKTIPQILTGIGKFVFRKLVSAGEFTLQLLKDIASFLHSVVIAIITRFKDVTLKDIAHAFSLIFVSFPVWIWETIRDAAIAIKNGTVWTLKQMGSAVYWTVWLFWQILKWIPVKLGEIALGVGEIVAAGGREAILWVHPKARVI